MILKISTKGLATLLLSCLITLLLNSCQKEEIFGLDPKLKSQTTLLGESRLFFEQNILRQAQDDRRLQARPKALRHRVGKTPLWDQAEKVQLSIGEAFKVPLAYREKVSLLIGPNKEAIPLAELSYLLLYKDRQQQWKAEVVTQVPHESYWTHRHELNRNFSGIIIVEDWWGRPIKTFKKVSNGHFVALANPVLWLRPGEKKNNQPQLMAPADCEVKVETNSEGMYEVELICDGPDGGNSDSESGGGWGGPGGFGGGGFGGHGGGGGGNGPDHGDYGEHPRGGGGGDRRNNNPPPPDKENVLRNQVQHPCLRMLVNQVIRTDVDDMISGIISKLDEDIFVQISVIDAPETTNFEAAETDLIKVPNSKIIMGTITLSTNVLSGSTKEYAVTVFIHEIIHSYMKYIGQNNALQQLEHQSMATTYINPMVNYLTSAFNLSLRDATALSWIGVNDSKSYINSTNFSYPGGSISKSQLEDIYRDYVSNRVGQSICNSGNIE